VAQPVVLVAVPDAQFALPLEQVQAVDFRLLRPVARRPRTGIAGGSGVAVDRAHEHGAILADVWGFDANGTHLTFNHPPPDARHAMACTDGVAVRPRTDASSRRETCASNRPASSSAPGYSSSRARRLAPSSTVETCGLLGHQAIASGAGATPRSAATALKR